MLDDVAASPLAAASAAAEVVREFRARMVAAGSIVLREAPPAEPVFAFEHGLFAAAGFFLGVILSKRVSLWRSAVRLAFLGILFIWVKESREHYK